MRDFTGKSRACLPLKKKKLGVSFFECIASHLLLLLLLPADFPPRRFSCSSRNGRRRWFFGWSGGREGEESKKGFLLPPFPRLRMVDHANLNQTPLLPLSSSSSSGAKFMKDEEEEKREKQLEEDERAKKSPWTRPISHRKWEWTQSKLTHEHCLRI